MKDKSNIVKPLHQANSRTPDQIQASVEEPLAQFERSNHSLSYAEICEEVLRDTFSCQRSTRSTRQGEAGSRILRPRIGTECRKTSEETPQSKPGSTLTTERFSAQTLTRGANAGSLTYQFQPDAIHISANRPQSARAFQIVKPYLASALEIQDRNASVELSPSVLLFLQNIDIQSASDDFSSYRSSPPLPPSPERPAPRKDSTGRSKKRQVELRPNSCLQRLPERDLMIQMPYVSPSMEKPVKVCQSISENDVVEPNISRRTARSCVIQKCT